MLKRFTLRLFVLPLRILVAIKHCRSKLWELMHWLLFSREYTNFTYELTDLNIRYLAQFLGVVCGRSPEVMAGFIQEIIDDEQLRTHVGKCISESKRNYAADDIVKYSRRIGWYAIVRATKPRVIIETGVDKGLGACVLTAALMKNDGEGYSGTYIGTDINPKAGYMLMAPYNKYGKILYGDSIESLSALDSEIDLFINDSDHSMDYEMREFETVSPRLSSRSIVLGDNSHFSDKLINFAQQTNRDFLFFQEQPQGHWYPGAGIGAAFVREQGSTD